jgi:hypothetical protein
MYGGMEPIRNRVVVPAPQVHGLAELVPWNRFLGSLKVIKIRAQILEKGKQIRMKQMPICMKRKLLELIASLHETGYQYSC